MSERLPDRKRSYHPALEVTGDRAVVFKCAGLSCGKHNGVHTGRKTLIEPERINGKRVQAAILDFQSNLRSAWNGEACW